MYILKQLQVTFVRTNSIQLNGSGENSLTAVHNSAICLFIVQHITQDLLYERCNKVLQKVTTGHT